MQVKLVEGSFERTVWTAASRKTAKRERVERDAFNNNVLKALLTQSLLDICSLTKKNVRDVLFQRLKVQRKISKFSISKNRRLTEKKRELRMHNKSCSKSEILSRIGIFMVKERCGYISSTD